MLLSGSDQKSAKLSECGISQPCKQSSHRKGFWQLQRLQQLHNRLLQQIHQTLIGVHPTRCVAHITKPPIIMTYVHRVLYNNNNKKKNRGSQTMRKYRQTVKKEITAENGHLHKFQISCPSVTTCFAWGILIMLLNKANVSPQIVQYAQTVSLFRLLFFLVHFVL